MGYIGLIAQLAIVAHARIDTSAGVNFHALLSPDTVYVGQQATFQVGVFIDDQLRLRLRHNPEFVPPDPQGMLAYELSGAARAPDTRRVGHHTYEVHVFQRAFFPLTVGRFSIPSAQLVYSLPLSASFFSREETHTLVAESLSVVARAPPTTGRPADYIGAVGDLTIAARLDSVAARVGDPMLLTLSVAGRGNVKLFPRPAIAVPWGSLVAGQVRVQLDTVSEDVRGTKEFDWLITPRDSGELTMPSVRYPYFDPYTERYEIAITRPSTVHVGPGSLALADTARSDAPPPLTLRAAYRGTPDPPLYGTPLYLALAVGAPVPALVLAVRRRPRRASRASSSAAGVLQELARSGARVDPVNARRVFVRALAERFALPPTVLTDRGALSHTLRLEGVTAATAEAAEGVLMALDRAAFGTGETLAPDVGARAYAAYRGVMSEARARRRTPPTPGAAGSPPRSALGIVVASLLAAAVAQALIPSISGRETAAFADGVRAYTAGEYRAAAAHFAAVTQWAPGAPDAWANAGTAAWAAGDTADAVVGWQHAGRLEPLARDVRERLALVRAPQDGPIARLPGVPAPLAADVALGCWLLACAAAAWRIGRGQVGLSAAPVICGALAVVAGASAVRANEAAQARHLAIVDHGAALYASPALDAERALRIEAGDVARILVTDGVWSQVRLDGEREGWVEAAQLIALEK